MKIVREDLHVLTGSYALDALTEPEREEFDRHLQHCPSCEAEVRGLREAAARLAMAKAVRPPARMQPRVLAATYRTRQLPPLAGERAVLEHRRAQLSRLFAGQLGNGRRALDHRRARMPRMPRLITVAAAASVMVAVGLGITQAATQHQLQSVRASDVAVTQVAQAPDARLETMRTSAGGTVTVVFSGQRRAAVITTTGLASLSSGRVYQLWVMSPAGARSEGLLSQPDQTSQVLASGVRSGDRIGITVEPSGGTSRPTTTPVLVMPLTT